MSEIRIDPISGEYVIISLERAGKPYDFKQNAEFIENNECPFCPGNEKMTPNSIMENKDINDNWNIRIVPNKYPFVTPVENEIIQTDSFYNKIDGYGVHDVVIDTPNHLETIFNFSKTHMEDIFFILQKRQGDIERNEIIKYVQVFKNHGIYSGASKKHSHWQIVGVPVVTQKQINLLENNKQYINKKGICGYCDIIKHELECKERLIAVTDNFVAITPYASKYAYEVWILPKSHIGSFLSFDEMQIKELALLFHKTINSLNVLFSDINFNTCFIGAPDISEYKNIHHWHLQIIPRMSNFAGFEFGTSCNINIFTPELAAKDLRENIR